MWAFLIEPSFLFTIGFGGTEPTQTRRLRRQMPENPCDQRDPTSDEERKSRWVRSARRVRVRAQYIKRRTRRVDRRRSRLQRAAERRGIGKPKLYQMRLVLLKLGELVRLRRNVGLVLVLLLLKRRIERVDLRRERRGIGVGDKLIRVHDC